MAWSWKQNISACSAKEGENSDGVMHQGAKTATAVGLPASGHGLQIPGPPIRQKIFEFEPLPFQLHQVKNNSPDGFECVCVCASDVFVEFVFICIQVFLNFVLCVCVQQRRHTAHKFESGLEVGVIKAFDKKGPHVASSA
jgi:hypothetical protein